MASLKLFNLAPELFVFQKMPLASFCMKRATARHQASLSRTGEISHERLIDPAGTGLAYGA